MAGRAELVGENLVISLKILHDVTTVLDKASIPYWLEGGTLLGVIREQRLLPWDNDMDISLDKKYQWKLLGILWKLVWKGYRVTVKYYQQSIYPFKKREVRIIKIRNYAAPFRKGDAVLDIFLKRNVDDQFYWTVGDKNQVLKSSPATFGNELGIVEFNGKHYSIPADFDAYLTFRYGDWNKQVKTWDFKKDDLAIIKPDVKG
ncbi:LicD family protein [bacterium]|nr:LicD family protein [bacterium]